MLQRLNVRMLIADLHWSRVGKCLAEFPLDSILRREVQLLEHLGAHGDTLGRAEAVERLHAVLAIVVFAIEGLVGHVVVLGVIHCFDAGPGSNRVQSSVYSTRACS